MKNLGQMMKQAQEMQAKMAEMQERLADIEVPGQAGAGMIAVVLNGKGELRSLKIDPKLVDPTEVEVLEDLIVAAFNDAKGKVEDGGPGRDLEADGRAEAAAGDEAAVLSGRSDPCPCASPIWARRISRCPRCSP